MSGKLTRFRIETLHNIRTIDVRITDNKLVLVGENGSGKSTVANFIYFFLTRQWHRMLNYKFKKVLAVIDSKEVVVNRSELEKIDERILRRYPSEWIREFWRLLREHSSEELHSNPERLYSFLPEDSPPSQSIKEIEEILNTSIIDQVLYLPTYRRIEQDLRSIFPELEDPKLRQIYERLKRKAGNTGYIELVEFGMEDVERTIQRKMEEVKDNVRNGLNNLTGTYLRDVIQGAY